MLLVFGNDRLNFGKFPNLMTPRIGIAALEFFAATPTFGRHARHNRLALFGGNQVAFVFRMAWLAAALAFGLGFVVGRRLVMRVCCRRRLGGIGGILAKLGLNFRVPRFEFCNPSGEILKKRHHRGRQRSENVR